MLHLFLCCSRTLLGPLKGKDFEFMRLRRRRIFEPRALPLALPLRGHPHQAPEPVSSEIVSLAESKQYFVEIATVASSHLGQRSHQHKNQRGSDEGADYVRKLVANAWRERSDEAIRHGS
jgi:hypothetical protein